MMQNVAFGTKGYDNFIVDTADLTIARIANRAKNKAYNGVTTDEFRKMKELANQKDIKEREDAKSIGCTVSGDTLVDIIKRHVKH